MTLLPQKNALALAVSTFLLASTLQGVNIAYVYQNQTQDWNLSQKGMSNSSSSVDFELTQDIRDKLLNDPSLSTDAQNILVSVTDRNVVLTGTVKSNSEKSKVESIVHKIKGVRRVSNKLQIAK